MPSLGVLWRTVRHLTLRQVSYQVRAQLMRRLGIRSIGKPLVLRWRKLDPKVLREKNTARVYLGDGAFSFNNETRLFNGDWNDATARKLWLYNLHYMGWLFDMTGDDAVEKREAWIQRWVRENPPPRGNGWEPYPLSLRIFNWCKHYTLQGKIPSENVLKLLEQQAGHLLVNLEFHLDANHLLENLLALCYVGFFLDPRVPRSRRALRRLGTLLDQELEAQFLEDGGHYELSPMYHAILLERLLDLLNVWPQVDDPFPGLRDKVRSTALAGLHWLDAMSVGDRFSLFNDACYDGAPEAGLLLDYGTQLLGWKQAPRQDLWALPDSGYYRAEAGPFTLIFDVGKLGPDHQMGHAQGDLLSFCLWMDKLPVFVHPGNYEYVAGEMRDYCRSTAAHNTLALQGVEQAEWWGSHRVGHRARPLETGSLVEDGIIRLWGAHDGYSRLPGRPIHRRRLELTTSSLTVHDVLSAMSTRSAEVRFHLHPDCSLEQEADALRIRAGSGCLSVKAQYPIRVEEGWYAPEFGLRIRNKVLVMKIPGSHGSCAFTFKGSRSDA